VENLNSYFSADPCKTSVSKHIIIYSYNISATTSQHGYRFMPNQCQIVLSTD